MKTNHLFGSLLTVIALSGNALMAQTTTPATATSTVTPNPALRAKSSTMYTEHTELFAEYRPPVVGRPNRFTAHLTRLGQTFSPYTEATVTLTLTIDGKADYTETLTKPLAPGNFRFALKPATAGRGTVTIDLVTPAYTEQFVVKDVTVYADEPTAIASQPAPEPTTGEIGYTKEKSWFEPFATAPVMSRKRGEISVLSVPQSALVSENDGVYVFVQKTPERFLKQVIKTGTRQGDIVEVVSGLQASDRIVILGTGNIN